MNMKDLKVNVREKMKDFCRGCPICNGVACAGEVPGMGGTGTGESFKSNVEDLKEIRVNLRTIHDATDPDYSYNFLGLDLKMPILGAPITGTQYNMGNAVTEKEYAEDVIIGAKNSGTVTMIGDGAAPDLYPTGVEVSNREIPNQGIGIIKPRSNEEIKDFIKLAEENNLHSVGIDIDGAGLITMALKGAPVGPKTLSDLKDLISSTELPFILKGIMTVDEAILAVEAGADAIVVSNHGGRVLDHCESTAKALPKIVDAVKGKITILVDSGIRSGVDVFKMLALGADAVLIGRPLIIGSVGGSDKGVEFIFKEMEKELYQTMILAGAKNLKDINRSMISYL